jgi:glycosyltransferase involved in cell wall biosynthesis
VRVLVVNQYFHPDRSATAQLLTELCDDLAQSSLVQVIAGRPSYNPVTDVEREGNGAVDVTRAWSTAFDRSWMPGRLFNYATYLAGSVVQAMVAARPDVLLAWTDPPLIGLVAAIAARARRVPLVLTTQDIFPDVAIQLGRLHNRAAIAVLRRAAKMQFTTAARVISIGRDMNERLVELGVPAAKLRTISNWADGNRILPLSSASPLRQAWGVDDKFVVMHSGNVGLSQSLDTLIGAAALLKDRADIVFVIVGEGAAKARLLADAERQGLRNVRFIAYQAKATLSESLGAADIHMVGLKRGLAGFIVPSKVYGIMAAGRPMVAAVEADSEPGRIIEEHRCGLRVEPDDPQALAAGIVALKNGSGVQMGQRARAAFEQAYDRPIATAAYRQVLEDAAGQDKPSQRP